MSRTFSSDKIKTQIPTWLNQTSDPNGGAGTTGGLGSVCLRNGSYPTRPTEIWLEPSSSIHGWVKENLLGLNVFNVTSAPYNCLPDGTTDCGPGVRQAVADANSAGGGIIYFPAAANFYRFAFTSVSVTSAIPLNNVSNIVFMGDGWASQLQLSGDMQARFQALALINNQSQRIVFYNLRVSGAGTTNADAAHTSPLIQISTNAPDLGPPHNVDIVQTWFDPAWADGVRTLGQGTMGGNKVTDVRVHDSMFNMASTSFSRDCISAQRNVSRIQVYDNWFGPCGTAQGGQQVDFEPGGGDPPAEWQIDGNIFNCTNSVAITLSGIDGAHGSQRLRCSYNIVRGEDGSGGAIEAAFTPTRVGIQGNVVVLGAGTTTGINPIELRNPTECIVSDNVAVSNAAVGSRGALLFFEDDGAQPLQCVVDGNLFKSVTATANVVTARFEASSQMLVTNNLVFSDCGSASGAAGVQFRSIAFEQRDVVVNGNVVAATSAQAYGVGINFATAPPSLDQHNIGCNYNVVANSSTAILFDASGANFLESRSVSGNNCQANAVQSVSPPSTNVGVTIEGTAGSVNAQIATISLAAGPSGNVTASPGAMCLSPSGAQNQVLWYKESGAANTAGWLAVGGGDIAFGTQSGSVVTAARFLAPGLGLATEGTVEIKLQMVRAGTLRNLRINCIAGSGGGTNTYTVRKNGANTSLAVSLANTGTTAANTTSAVVVAAGDAIAVQVTKALAPTTPQSLIAISFELV